jgi:hypothetical protein
LNTAFYVIDDKMKRVREALVIDGVFKNITDDRELNEIIHYAKYINEITEKLRRLSIKNI